SGRALHVVVKDAIPVTVALEQMDGVGPCPILEVDTAFGKYFLDRFDKLIDKGEEFIGWWPGFAHAQIKWIVEVLLVIGAGIQVHGEQELRRHTRAGGVKLQLADGNRRAVCAEVAESKDTTAIGDADDANILLRPVFQDL